MQTIPSASSAASCAVAAALDDLTLVHACKQGDVDAFEQLVKRYDAKLLRIAQHITHNRENAEEAVQEAFFKAFRNLSSFQEKSRFSTWLFRITVNESLMKLRRQRREKAQAQEPIMADEIADWAPNPEQLYGPFELRNILRRQLQGLQPSLRVIFILRDIEGLSTDESAEVLGLTRDAVKARLWRARLDLRERLSKYFGVHSLNIPAREKAAEGGR